MTCSRRKVVPLLVVITTACTSLVLSKVGAEEAQTARQRALARARAPRSPFRPAPIPPSPPRPSNRTACNYQDPLPFLIHKRFTIRPETPRAEHGARKALQAKAIRYRTERYGHVPGFGRPLWNPRRPGHFARWTTFMGRPVQMNTKLFPALDCVEDRILIECAETTYRPWKLSGIRFENSHYNNEVSNHLYGIAIDVDPGRNTCCGCIPPWSEHPTCLREVDSIYERMAMPSCWVHVFERFGFYWLGRGRIQDTMHFEFLGDPDGIVRRELNDRAPPPTSPGPSPVPES